MTAPARRVLVTGATGFVGRHLCAALLEHGWLVRGVVRQADDARLPHGAEPIVVPAVHSRTDWSAALVGVDAICHLAAIAHRIGAAEPARVEEYFEVNALGTARLAQAAAESVSVRRLVFLSSIAVTGSFADQAVSERTVPAPETPYGESKHQAEQWLSDTLEGSETEWCTLRAPLVYGRGNPGNMARLLRLVRSGLPLPFGSTYNRRSFIFVRNLTDAIRLALDHPAAARGTFTVADREVVSTAELLKTIGRVSHRAPRLLPCPVRVLRWMGRVGDVAGNLIGRSVGLDSYSVDRLVGSLEVDSTTIQTRLGWHPAVSLEAGLAEALLPARAEGAS